METIVTMISQVGFPIGAFIMLFFFMKNELSEMKKTIDQNTLTVSALLTYIEAKEGSDIDGK